MKQFAIKYSGFLFLCISAVTSYSQDTLWKKNTLHEINITAARDSIDAEQLPFTLYALSRPDILNKGSRSTPEALHTVTGVFVQKTNHGGGSPFVRGLTGNQTLLVVDGIRLNNSIFRYGPNQYLNTIDPYTIRKIEVVPGTGSVQYGSDAIGGVIQLLTRDPELAINAFSPGAHVTGKMAGFNMEQSIRTELNIGSKKTGTLAGFSWRNFGDLRGGKNTGRQSPSGYAEKAIDLKSVWQTGERSRLIIANQFLQQRQVPIYHKIQLENYLLNEVSDQTRQLAYVKLQLMPRSAWLNKIELTPSYQFGREKRVLQKKDATTRRYESDRVHTLGVQAALYTGFMKGWSANTGIEIYADKVRSSRTEMELADQQIHHARGLYPDHAGYQNYSLYTLHQFQLDRLDLHGGLRYNYFQITLSDETLGKVKLNPAALVSNFGANYALGSGHHVFAVYSQGFRAPNIDDLGTLGIVDFRYEIPQGNLKPERSQHYELGYKISTVKMKVQVSGYYLKLKDLITRSKLNDQIINGYPVYQKVNSGSARISGAELDVKFRLTSFMSASGGLAYAQGQDLSKLEPMRRIPPLNGNFSVNYQTHKWYAGIDMLWAASQHRLAKGDTEDNRIGPAGTQGWQVINLNGGWNFKKIKLKAGIINLLNADYKYHGSGINEPGLNGWLSVGVEI